MYFQFFRIASMIPLRLLRSIESIFQLTEQSSYLRTNTYISDENIQIFLSSQMVSIFSYYSVLALNETNVHHSKQLIQQLIRRKFCNILNEENDYLRLIREEKKLEKNDKIDNEKYRTFCIIFIRKNRECLLVVHISFFFFAGSNEYLPICTNLSDHIHSLVYSN